ncbi:MAG: DNA polymerase III subunit delta [Treponema sp.]|nr:DNA polymerase III subunit delta [Treponema sp.]
MEGGAANSYIFLGPELGKKQDAVDSIKKKFPSSETSVFYAGETSVSVIADSIQNHSLFAEARIIIIKNAELIKKKDETELLVSCVKNLESGVRLIFLSDEIRLVSGLDDCVPNANRQVFYEMIEREKNEWVMSFFRREGYSIGNDCAAAILELVENNTEALRRECSRLIMFLPKDKPVKAEDIDKWLSHNREESAFTLFSRIAAGDLSKALESLSVMLAAKEKAQGILAGLAWCFRKLNDYLSLQESGNAGNNFELKKIGLSSPKARDDYAAASRRYSAEAVEKCLALTAEYDMLLRSPVSVMEEILMDRYVLAVVNAGGRNYI